MAKTRKPEETIAPSDDLIAQAILEGQALTAEGKTKVEAKVLLRQFNSTRLGKTP
jgi:hypothetical protein